MIVIVQGRGGGVPPNNATGAHEGLEVGIAGNEADDPVVVHPCGSGGLVDCVVDQQHAHLRGFVAGSEVSVGPLEGGLEVAVLQRAPVGGGEAENDEVQVQVVSFFGRSRPRSHAEKLSVVVKQGGREYGAVAVVSPLGCRHGSGLDPVDVPVLSQDLQLLGHAD